MTEQHTPGPWVVYHRKPGSPQAPFSSDMPEIMAKNGPVIADIRWNGHNATHGEANARLIASAPETAAERDRLRNMLESIANNRLSTDIPPDEKLEHDHAQGWDSLVLAARAALKAGGG